ncbi:MAG: VIT domain-containing protein [Pyrinomonadaceae bacterium]
MRKVYLPLIIFLSSTLIFFTFWPSAVPVSGNALETPGSLSAFTKKGDSLGFTPLKHTDVKAEISGFLARVRVTQEFENNFDQAVEAVYTFPLPNNSAVDQMTMRIGERTVKGKIMERGEAREVYETAKNDGKTASLLDQERPNIFTQQVANIPPGEKVVVEISYVEPLKYEGGSYEFVFPMVIGQRYNPDSAEPDDAARISPSVAKERAGHDISLEVDLEAGVPIEAIESESHQVNTLNLGSDSAKVSLRDEKTIPNKDFILRYDVTGGRIEDAILAHRDAERGGFFTLILQPPDRFAPEDITPKELVFVIDTSGSMSGFPIEKAKEAMRMSLEGLHPEDTFNLITFAGDTNVLFEKPVPATRANLDRAHDFLNRQRGGGGTEMMKAIRAAFDSSGSKEHLRIVCFMTDGQVGNEAEILSEIQKHPNARVFSFGIGNSVNRHLLDKMAEEGRGEVEYVSLDDNGSAAAEVFYQRVRTPLLTDVSIDWNSLPVSDVYPRRSSDLFSAKPLILNGRYEKAASGTIKLKGRVGGQYYEREIAVDLPETESRHDVLATLWARRKIDELASRDYGAAQDDKAESKVRSAITDLGLKFGLMTRFTSFVAVEEKVVNHNGQPVRVEVPVEDADGAERENESERSPDQTFRRLEILNNLQSPRAKYSAQSDGRGTGSGQGSGRGTGRGSGIGSGSGSSPGMDRGGGGGGGREESTLMVKKVPRVQEIPVSKARLATPSPNNKNSFIIDFGEIDRFRREHPEIKMDQGNRIADYERITLEVPETPPDLKLNKKNSVVELKFKADHDGSISVINSGGGTDALRKAAEVAVSRSGFPALALNGQPLAISGIIIYRFIGLDKVHISLKAARVELPPEARRRILLKEKLHFWVYDLTERLDRNDPEPAVEEAKFVLGGKARLRLTLTRNTPRVLAALKKAGLNVTEIRGRTVSGEIAPKKIGDLAEIKEVKYIAP